MQCEVRIIPNASKFQIIERENGLTIKVKSKPDNGKANVELIEELEKHLKRRVVILRGRKSRNKVIEIDGEKQEVLKTIKEIISS